MSTIALFVLILFSFNVAASDTKGLRPVNRDGFETGAGGISRLIMLMIPMNGSGQIFL